MPIKLNENPSLPLWKRVIGQGLVGAANVGEKIGDPQKAFSGLSKVSGEIATGIKNIGYSDDTAENKKKFINNLLDKGYDKEAILTAMKHIDQQGGFQGSWTSNPITGTLSSVVAAPFQAAQSYAGGLSKYAEGSKNVMEGKVGLGAAQAVQGGL